MTFDLNRFRAATLGPRQEPVAVPDLAAWFDAGAEPVWIVRGMTGEEIARANDSAKRTQLFAATVEALASAAKSEQADALMSLMGVSDVPDDLAKRFDYLTFCSVDPVISREDAVRMFAYYPIVAYQLTNKILELTGLGPDLGKVPPSTETPPSSPH